VHNNLDSVCESLPLPADIPLITCGTRDLASTVDTLHGGSSNTCCRCRSFQTQEGHAHMPEGLIVGPGQSGLQRADALQIVSS
jgi:hypothetical protein